MNQPSASKPSSAWRVMAVIPAFIGMTAAGLVACGGGSDAGSATGGNGTTATAAQLDQSNYKAAAGAIVADGLAAMVEFDPQSLDLADTVVNKPLARTLGKSLEAARRAKTGVLSGTTQSTVTCPGGGTVVLETRTEQPATSSVGDGFTIVYDNCIEPDLQSQIDGRVDLAITHAGVGDFFVDPAYNVRLTYTVTQLRVIDTTGTTVADGTIDVESVRTAFRQGFDSLTIPRMESSFTPLGGAREWSTVTDFAARRTLADSTVTVTVDGTVAASDGLNQGSVVVDTTTPFVRSFGQFPSVGVLTATGARGSKVEVRAIDNTTVRLSLDSNGDGTWDAVEDVPWVSIW